jgi:ectoine hydroxylase-related dioxygenase (phytanoyl-CoA dioxygenase family)
MLTACLDIDSPYSLTKSQIEFYRENGFIHLKNVLSREVLEHYGREISNKVIELNTLHLPMKDRTTYQKAFLQIENIWRKSDVVKEFVFGKRIARIAAELMGTVGVRMYHDQALYKEAGGGHTPWHVDQFYWPLASAHSITAWIPLQDTPMEMGPLAFGAKSHQLEIGRHLEISDESEEILRHALTKERIACVEEPFALGEVSFHSGWTYHRAGPNRSGRTREVMTIIMMDEDMRLAPPKNKSQVNDWNAWCPGAVPGQIIETPMNPVLFSFRNNPTTVHRLPES